MPQFMLSVYHDPQAQSEGSVYADEAAMQAAFEKVAAFNTKLTSSNALHFVGALTDPAGAVVIHPTEAEPLVEDGPAHDGRQLGGFWVVEAEHLDAARVLAAEAASACGQPVEVRAMEG